MIDDPGPTVLTSRIKAIRRSASAMPHSPVLLMESEPQRLLTTPGAFAPRKKGDA